MLTQSCDPQLAPHAAAKAVRSGANPFSPLALHHLPHARGLQPSLLLLLPRAPGLQSYQSSCPFQMNPAVSPARNLHLLSFLFFFFCLKRPAQLSAHREPAFSFHMSECFCFWGNLSELCFFFCYLKYLVLLLSLFVDMFVFLKSVELHEDRDHLFNSCLCPTFPLLPLTPGSKKNR